jgi:hypothetical protein
MLRSPVEHTKEEIAQMTDKERVIASKAHDGMMIISEVLPEETVALLNAVYSLIERMVKKEE